MSQKSRLVSRDLSDSFDQDSSSEPGLGNLLFPIFAFLLTASCVSVVLVYLRRKRRARQQPAMLPLHYRPGHHRSSTISTTPRTRNGQSVFVYDEKMNLIANSTAPSNRPIPEIRITFPDEESNNGSAKSGRVVVVRITDSGSVGMEPLRQDPLPPYQQSDAERFQSLDLDRIGGLREKEASNHRWT